MGGITHSQTNCECGEYATGRTFYQVGDYEECCSGKPGKSGLFVQYEQSEGGTWKVVRSIDIEGSQAQKDCCEEAA